MPPKKCPPLDVDYLKLPPHKKHSAPAHPTKNTRSGFSQHTHTSYGPSGLSKKSVVYVPLQGNQDSKKCTSGQPVQSQKHVYPEVSTVSSLEDDIKQDNHYCCELELSCLADLAASEIFDVEVSELTEKKKGLGLKR